MNPPARTPYPTCTRCKHSWHGLACQSHNSAPPPASIFGSRIPGAKCDCPTSFEDGDQ